MATAQIEGVCDRCKAPWGGRRRLCLQCRQQLRPFGRQYEVQHQRQWLAYLRRINNHGLAEKQRKLVDLLETTINTSTHQTVKG